MAVLPLGGILLAVFVGWVWGANWALTNGSTTRIVFFLLRYVSPALIPLVMIKGLNML
jgi:NSS family neurotransmitter:Na+ symporter